MSVNKSVFYWNCADDKNYKHQRIEWAIQNGYLVCVNITIHNKLFNKVKIGDIILAYEPKYHRLSQFKNGDDGYCMSCNNTRNDGLQAFTTAFIITGDPKILENINDEQKYGVNIFRNWYTTIKHCKDDSSKIEWLKQYYLTNKIYIFPVKLWKYLDPIISTDKCKKYPTMIYYGSIRKGFDIIDDMYITRLLNHQFAKSSINNIIF